MNRILVTCPRGAAPYLVKEIEAMGLVVSEHTESAATTEGDFRTAMLLNLHLRTAHRVLLLFQEFEAENPDQMYEALKAMPWEDHLHEKGYVSVTSIVDTPAIRDSQFASLRAKDAIVDRMNEVFGARPDSGPRRDRAVVHLYWKDDKGTIYLDTSGEPVSRRGYRKEQGKAPMGEALAAAVVMATGWDGRAPFINPMCGSGTLAIEAALIAMGKPPGILRQNFGFMHLKDFDKQQWEAMRHKSVKRSMRMPGTIIATDHDREVVKIAKRNAARAGVEHLIEFRTCDFSETPVSQTRGRGVVLMNPEYGARMGAMKPLESVYRGIGDFFKQRCAGYTGFIFTGNPVLAKRVGLRTASRETFYNGPIECRLLKYELYEGSKKY